MYHKDRGIVLRSVKYGESSLIVTVFTELSGVHAYMVQGVRTEKKRNARAGLLQVASLLELVAEHRPNRHLQRLKEFHPAYFYQHLQEDIIRNSIAVFSVELLQKLLPQQESMPDLFDFCYHYFTSLDQTTANANYPLFFIIRCGRMLGYNILGTYSAATPFLSLQDGSFAAQPPGSHHALQEEDISALATFLSVDNLEQIHGVKMNAAMRNRLLDWYIRFLQHHTQHLADLRSPEVLRAILH
jgi:DNA repair protein RecO (recombination protein O)